MKKQILPLKIVLTGPESSGKTTIASRLAAELGGELVAEFARPYLTYLGRPYVHNDLVAILSGQNAWEKWHLEQQKSPFVVCDTDWTVLRIWESYRFSSIAVTQHETPSPNTLYCLCTPDIPWEADDLREHPTERELLFVHYHELLQQLQANFIVLQGSVAERLKIALEVIRKLS